MPIRLWTDEVLGKLEELYCVEGLDLEDIAREMGKSEVAIYGQIRILGLRLTPQAVQARKARGIKSRRWDTPINRDYSAYGMRRPDRKPAEESNNAV